MTWRSQTRRPVRRPSKRSARRIANFEVGDPVKISNPIIHGHGEITGVVAKHSSRPQTNVYRVKLRGRKKPIKALGISLKKD